MNILIDDDKYQHMSWSIQAKRQGKDLLCYFNIEEFLKHHHLFDKDSKIFVDSDLKTNVPGEIGAKNIFDKGFSNIFLVTSFTDIDLKSIPWIKEIRSKSFQL